MLALLSMENLVVQSNHITLSVGTSNVMATSMSTMQIFIEINKL